MTEIRRDEKQEKDQEKEEEKRTEKQEEKSWDEKWRRDPLAAAAFGAVLIWAGLVLLGDNLGLIARLRPFEAWDLIFIGAGVIVLLLAAIRVLVPSYRRPVAGNLIIGVILLAVGLGDVVGTAAIWSLALIVLGVGLLLRAMIGRR